MAYPCLIGGLVKPFPWFSWATLMPGSKKKSHFCKESTDRAGALEVKPPHKATQTHLGKLRKQKASALPPPGTEVHARELKHQTGVCDSQTNLKSQAVSSSLLTSLIARC
jgi:hypothetical protein